MCHRGTESRREELVATDENRWKTDEKRIHLICIFIGLHLWRFSSSVSLRLCGSFLLRRPTAVYEEGGPGHERGGVAGEEEGGGGDFVELAPAAHGDFGDEGFVLLGV